MPPKTFRSDGVDVNSIFGLSKYGVSIFVADKALDLNVHQPNITTKILVETHLIFRRCGHVTIGIGMCVSLELARPIMPSRL